MVSNYCDTPSLGPPPNSQLLGQFRDYLVETAKRLNLNERTPSYVAVGVPGIAYAGIEANVVQSPTIPMPLQSCVVWQMSAPRLAAGSSQRMALCGSLASDAIGGRP